MLGHPIDDVFLITKFQVPFYALKIKDLGIGALQTCVEAGNVCAAEKFFDLVLSPRFAVVRILIIANEPCPRACPSDNLFWPPEEQDIGIEDQNLFALRKVWDIKEAQTERMRRSILAAERESAKARKYAGICICFANHRRSGRVFPQQRDVCISQRPVIVNDNVRTQWAGPVESFYGPEKIDEVLVRDEGMKFQLSAFLRRRKRSGVENALEERGGRLSAFCAAPRLLHRT